MSIIKQDYGEVGGVKPIKVTIRASSANQSMAYFYREDLEGYTKATIYSKTSGTSYYYLPDTATGWVSATVGQEFSFENNSCIAFRLDGTEGTDNYMKILLS